jgi:RNA polymerase sigma-B factor
MTAHEHDLSRPLSRADRHAVTNELLDSAATSNDSTQRQDAIHEAVVLNMSVARSLAWRYRDRGVPTEDLEQVAYVALLRAAQNYDPRQADDFLTYAVPSVRGELKKYFRDLAWVVRPPRRVQEIQTKVLSTQLDLEGCFGRPPTVREIADALCEDVADVREALLCQGCFTPTSLDMPTEPAGRTTLQDWLTDDADEEAHRRIEVRAVLEPVLRRLPPRDRRILLMRFVHDRTQQEIADELGITQMQVSRLLSRIMRDVRYALERTAATTALTG